MVRLCFWAIARLATLRRYPALANQQIYKRYRLLPELVFGQVLYSAHTFSSLFANQVNIIGPVFAALVGNCGLIFSVKFALACVELFSVLGAVINPRASRATFSALPLLRLAANLTN